MWAKHLLRWVLPSLALVSGVTATSEEHGLDVPRMPSSSSDALHALSKRLYHSKLLGRAENPKNAISIARSWDGATLFSLEVEAAVGNRTSVSAGIEVTCVTCYVKGLVTTELGFDDDFDIGQAIKDFANDIGEEFDNVTSVVTDYIHDQAWGFIQNVTGPNDVSFPPLDIDFNVDVPDIPECRLRFQFDDLELYMLIDIVLSVGTTYTFNIYSSNTPIGFSTGDEMLGVIVSIDLIIDVNAEVDISSGVHIKVDDGMGLDLSLFSDDVSDVTFNGASFEFLPVTVQSGSGALKATLRIGLYAGIAISDGFDIFPLSFAAGGMVYADVAEFTTNITAVADGDDSGCALRVQQGYQFALGAAAGVMAEIGDVTWAPGTSTQTPIFYTTLADECVWYVTGTAAVASTDTVPTPAPALLEARQQEDTDTAVMMTTTTLSEDVTYTGQMCLSTGLVACPASLRSVRKIKSTRTLVVTVPSGSEATFPATTRDAIGETIPFATNVKSVDATTGIPVSYVPPPPPPSSSATTAAGGPGDGSGGQPPNIPLIVGLSVGLGVPFLAAVVASIYFCFRRRQRYAAVAPADVAHVVSPQSYADDAYPRDEKKTMAAAATVTTTTIG
ncbi:hypothetical protein F5Y14DRAFT_445686 [Nemania sp. NC0429]|nr:hypothetical protein F5Y14DRAFT_445686 [Nemania sp. NC0429]